MGYKTSSARRSSAQSAVASSIVVLPDTTGTGPTLSGSGVTANTTINKQIVTVGQSATQATTVLSGVTVTSVFVTDSSFNILDDTSLDPAGGYLKIVGTGFKSGCAVYLNGSSVTTTFISSTEVRVTTPASSVGTYNLMIFNSDGNGAIYLNLGVSNFPAYTTSAGSLGTVYETNDYTQSVVATGDAPLTYSLYSGSLPPNATLTANGVISGTSPVENSSNTYSFVVNVKDAQGQDTTRSFSLTINTDAISWSTPANNTSYSLAGGSAMANVSLSATSAAGKSITYTANSLPTGVALSGNTIYGTPNTAQTVYTELTATSATTNRSAKRYISWNISLGDTYFKYVTLLINGETSSNTFINDASSNNAQLTIVGDTKPSNFNPYAGGYYSNYFDGSGDYLTVPNNAALQLESGDFTIEFWINYNSIAGYQTPYSKGYTAAGDILLQTGNGNGAIVVYLSGSAVITESTGANIGQWYHYSLVRSGTTVTLYRDGVSRGTATSSVNFNTTNQLAIGATGKAPGGGAIGDYPINGYMSNVRVVKGTAVYTTSFTPSTTPLTAISGTSLLTCQSSRFIDNSTNAFTVTPVGNAAISSAIPFTQSSNSLGSAYFDGTGDYLSTSTSPGFGFGTGTFTFESWVYPTSNPTNGPGTVIDCRTGTNAEGWVVRVFNNLTIGIYDGPSNAYVNSTGTVTMNAWNHIAIVRTSTSSGGVAFYINGVASTGTIASNLGTSWIANIGHNYAAGYDFYGYIQDLRVLKGTALYTSNFLPPQSPLTPVTNTQLLTLQYNGGATNNGFVDQSSFNNIITRSGNVTQGTFSPYSQNGWSNYFDGTGDYLSVANNTAFNLGSGNFTMECWVNYNALPSSGSLYSFGGLWNSTGNYSHLIALQNNSGTYRINIYHAPAGGTAVTTSTIGNWTPSIGTWYHVAVVRSGTTVTGYVNGSSIGSVSVSTTFHTSSTIYTVGSAGADGHNINGHISNFRLLKGTALYSTTFTPSTTPLTAVANTSLLTCQDNRLIDNSPNNFSITKVGDVSVQAYSPFGGVTSVPTSYSTYFDGTGDYLQTPASSATSLIGGSGAISTTSTFTIEGWIYQTQRQSYDYGCMIGDMGTNGSIYWGFGPNATGKLAFRWSDGSTKNAVGDSTISLNTWTHIALSISSGTIKMFVDGVLQTITGTSSTTNQVGTLGYLLLGGFYTFGSTYGYFGHISNLRITKSALYTENFTPSTTPLTTVANTSLLTCQSNTMIDNSPNYFTLTANGDVKPRPFNPFGTTTTTQVAYSPSVNGGSMYFDGTGDYLQTATGLAHTDITQTDYTVECWVYNKGAGAERYIFSQRGANSGWELRINADNTVSTFFTTGTTFTTTATVPANAWTHIAVTRLGTTIRVFINGIQSATGTQSNGTSAYASYGLWLGNGTTAGSGLMLGHISDARVIRGQSLYNANFYPGTTPATPTNNTSYLLNGTSGGIVDAHGTNVLETVGNIQLSPLSPYASGGKSLYFNGTSSKLVIPASPQWALGTSDFTIEFWMNTSDTGAGLITPATTGAGYWSVLIYSGTLYWQNAYNQSNLKTASLSGYLNNSWVHVAIVRSSGSMKFYFNGVAQGTATSDSTNYSGLTNTLTIGYDGAGNGYYSGYITDLRITKGYARYTTNFTAPTVPLDQK